MGSQTLAGFRSDLVFDLENRADTGLTDARLNAWINWAYLHSTRPGVREHDEMRQRYDFTLVTSTNEYTLSRALTTNKVLGVYNVTHFAATTVDETATRTDVRPKNINWMDIRVKTNGAPKFYAIDGNGSNKILVFNTLPTTVENGQMVRVRFWGEPTLMATDAATTVLSEYWDTVIQQGALFRAKWVLGYREEAVADGQVYQQLINETLEDINITAEDTGQQAQIHSEQYMENAE